jgi:hypothetical protein
MEATFSSETSVYSKPTRRQTPTRRHSSWSPQWKPQSLQELGTLITERLQGLRYQNLTLPSENTAKLTIQNVSLTGNAYGSYSGGDRFESPLGHQLPSGLSPLLYLVSSGKFRGTNWNDAITDCFHIHPVWLIIKPSFHSHVRWVPVTKTWHVLSLHPDMEGSCE